MSANSVARSFQPSFTLANKPLIFWRATSASLALAFPKCGKQLLQFRKDAFERGPLARFAHDAILRDRGAERDARSGRRIDFEGTAIPLDILCQVSQKQGRSSRDLIGRVPWEMFEVREGPIPPGC